ncbi:MAG: PspC protein [Bacteroidetes bacterium]|nr:PspC protein [Bacteroidota bacterium]
MCVRGNKLAPRPYTTIDVFLIPFRLSTPKGASMDSTTASTPSTPSTPESSSTLFRNRDRGSVIGGLVLIVLGALFLLDNFFDIRFGDLWPLILVAVGVGLLWRSRNTEKQ